MFFVLWIKNVFERPQYVKLAIYFCYISLYYILSHWMNLFLQEQTAVKLTALLSIFCQNWKTWRARC